MTIWRCLLLVYPRINVRVPKGFGFSERFTHEMPSTQVEEAVASFRCFPPSVSNLTNGAEGIEYKVATVERTLSSLTSTGKNSWWPSLTNTQAEMERCDVRSKYDSVFVFWPQNNLQENTSIPSGGWGLGMGASDWSMGATFATVANIHSSAWKIPLKGEVWLHEWLHGVCAHFAKQAHKMPDGDADGADRHGYVRSPKTGWTDYYRDLMNGRVMEEGRSKGIPSSAWQVPISKQPTR